MEEKKKDNKFIEESLIRILSTDIPGDMSIYAGLTRIKGVSWSYSNAVCNMLKIDKMMKISELNEEEIKKISEFIKNPRVPEFVLNRKKDLETGKSGHLTGVDLDMAKEFDIKRMKKIRSYKGIRHILGQPVRGQRTKSHFRKNRAVGVMGKSKKGKKT
jgi:small subunit ribosomal protein S13